MGVYAGRYLRFDLNTGQHWVRAIEEALPAKWLLGSGLAAKLLSDQLDPSLSPLDPRSPLIIFNGLLTGTFAPAACRTSWCGVSPQTGIWNESNMGGHWGAELRFAGYDGIVISGRSERPVYLWINGVENVIELRDASHVWGCDYFDAADRLIEETDPKARVAGIGIAGENLVRIAGVMTGPSQTVRGAARGGMGALMGSKNLKAILVRGADRPDYYDREALRDEVQSLTGTIKEYLIGASHFGTAGGFLAAEASGDLPLRNWTLGDWEDAEQVSGQSLYSRYLVKHTRCFACPIGCGKEVEVESGRFATPKGEGVEYETVAGFAGLTMNANAESVILANSLCNRYGLDTISTSSVIAFAMEAFERGAIDLEDTGGVDLRFGNPDAVVAMVEQIARQQAIGKVLGHGVREAARQIGAGSERYAVHVKGLEVAYHDPRSFLSMAVSYATAARGGCHLEGLTYWNGYGTFHPDLGYSERIDHQELSPRQARMAYDYQNFYSVFNPLGLCKFIAKGKVGPEKVCNLVNDSMGWDLTPQDLLLVGERLFQLKRLINLRLGVTAADDSLPERLVKLPRPSGAAAGVVPDMEVLLADYYALRDWDKSGRPSENRLAELGLAQEAGAR